GSWRGGGKAHPWLRGAQARPAAGLESQLRSSGASPWRHSSFTGPTVLVRRPNSSALREIPFDSRRATPHNPLVSRQEVFGAAVDATFRNEMSNLSPPLIFPPPSAL